MNPDDLAALAAAAEAKPELAGVAGFSFAFARFVLFPLAQSGRLRGKRLQKGLHTTFVGTVLAVMAGVFSFAAGVPFFPAASAAFVGGFGAMALHGVQKKRSGDV